MRQRTALDISILPCRQPGFAFAIARNNVGLAGSVRADKGNDLALPNREADAAEDGAGLPITAPAHPSHRQARS